MNTEQSTPSVPLMQTLDNHTSSLVMRWPVRTCISCAHADCDRRRRDRNVPCGNCGARIRIGDRYRVTGRIDGDVVSQIHEDCERRTKAR